MSYVIQILGKIKEEDHIEEIIMLQKYVNYVLTKTKTNWLCFIYKITLFYF